MTPDVVRVHKCISNELRDDFPRPKKRNLKDLFTLEIPYRKIALKKHMAFDFEMPLLDFKALYTETKRIF